MQIDKISNTPSLDFYTLHNVLASNKITDYQKIQFIKKNSTQIYGLVEFKLSDSEFLDMMQNRPLERFKPIKNSFTKQGDKIILAKSLGILPSQLDDYIKNVTVSLQNINEMKSLNMDKIDSVKTYVFRHGTRPQVVTFLNYELKKTKNIMETLNTTLEYGTGGMADFFTRPIHKMGNKTFLSIYNVINNNLKDAFNNGIITEAEKQKALEYSLAKLCRIQQNSRLIRRK